jgi:hypothetical protein
MRVRAARWREAHPETARARVRQWKNDHPDRQKAAELRYALNNPEKVREAARKYKATHADEEKQRRSAWAANNLPGLAAKAAHRRSLKKSAAVSWGDIGAIRAIYAEARRLTLDTGVPHHVDHTVPLQSEIVCGLHWEGNLEIVEGRANLSKGNRSWPDMP